MTYVKRNSDGDVVGMFALPQPGVAEEELAEDHADVKAFKARFAPNAVKDQIDNLERFHLAPRFLREYILQDFEAKAAAAGKDPAALPAYAKLKALDRQIAVLRAQL